MKLLIDKLDTASVETINQNSTKANKDLPQISGYKTLGTSVI